MNEENVMCNNCDWTGDDSELVRLTDNADDLDFSYCPDCKSDDIEDLENDQQ